MQVNEWATVSAQGGKHYAPSNEQFAPEDMSGPTKTN